MAQISIVIPTYNRGWSLKRCLDSVIAQSFRDFECIVVNDGSTDNTSDILKDYTSISNFKILEQENQGVSAARNFGVQHSTSEWLAFLDSDDEWLPQKLEHQMMYTHRHGYEVSQTQEIWIRNGKRVNPPKYLLKKEGDIFKESIERCMITPSSVVMKRSLFEHFNGFDTELPVCEDYDLWLKITHTYPVGLVPENLMIRYGGHEDQLSSAYEVMDTFRIESMLNLLSHTTLDSEKRKLLVNTLRTKLEIVNAGATKRQNKQMVAFVAKKKIQLDNML